jgi:RNA recognition motif-containing protein
MSTKIYVGNISFKATEDDIRELFSECGEVASVNLITDPNTGQLKGFGFVEMATEEMAREAIAALNGRTFMERTLSVAEARPQQPRERRPFGERKGGFGGGRGHGGRGHGRGRR